MRLASLLAAISLGGCMSHLEPEPASSPPGRELVARNCGACHAISRSDTSAHPAAPALRHLSRSYPVLALEESLAEGIMVGHPDMPEFQFEPDEIDAIISYLQSIQQD